MPTLSFKGQQYSCRDGDTVLDTFMRFGVTTPFSCRNGICHICLLRQTNASPPEPAQQGLRDSLKEQGYFLSCQCTPTEDMELAPARDADLFSRATVRDKFFISPDICRVLLEPATPLYYRAGQFINLRCHDGLTRSYSLASNPREDEFLELHIMRIPNGASSNWIFDELKIGDELDIQGPEGGSYYIPGRLDQKIVMVGTGTGLAPLYGILRDALHSGHKGDIYLYHGSRHTEGLYLHHLLSALAMKLDNFHYTSCISGDRVNKGIRAGRAHDIAFAEHKDLHNARVYLCGNPGMVEAGQQMALAAGVNKVDIHNDPFELSHSISTNNNNTAKNNAGADGNGERRYPNPDPELWAALSEGKLLMDILKDFYALVFADPKLKSFFVGVTKQRLIEKQYNFLYQVLTGKNVYFGERPRNAHHWMIISDELFDYRTSIMEQCWQKHGLPDEYQRRWLAIEEVYRPDIVKSEPWPKMMFGKPMPLDGFGMETLDIASMCDNCEKEIAAGETVRYHLRLGTIHCHDCMENAADASSA